MIKPNGTGRHTHALNDFAVQSISHPGNKSTISWYFNSKFARWSRHQHIYYYTKIHDYNIIVIKMDLESVDYHFGDSPLYS